MNKSKSRSVRGAMSNMLHQCVPYLPELSVFVIIKEYLPFFQILLNQIYSFHLLEKYQQNCHLNLHC